MEQALKDANISNVTIHRIGLFNDDTMLELSMPPNHSGMASVIQRGDNWKSVMIQLRETAAYVSPLVGDRPFGVKIDIEGAEPNVLPALFNMPNMKFAVCEAAHNTWELYNMARENNFLVFGLCRSVWSVFRPRTKEIKKYEDMSAYHDIVFTRK